MSNWLNGFVSQAANMSINSESTSMQMSMRASFFIEVKLLNLQWNCIWKLKSCPDLAIEGSAKVTL